MSTVPEIKLQGGCYLPQWQKLWGGWGGNCPPPQFNKTRKIFLEVRNFEGGIETAVKKRVAVEKERVPILNEQTKCSRSICSIFFGYSIPRSVGA